MPRRGSTGHRPRTGPGPTRRPTRDSLTGLPDRQSLLAATRSAIARARRHSGQGVKVGLVLIDIDRFRQVNDALGYAAGDLLLARVAARLRRALYTDGLLDLAASPATARAARRAVVSRIGDDEFAVLLPHITDGPTLIRVARALIAHATRPADLDGLRLLVEASAGACLYPDRADDGEALLRHADVALRQAQRRGTGLECYDPAHDRDTPQRIALLGDLQHALRAGAVQLHYQPKTDFRDRVLGVEALLRWTHPVHGYIAPSEFIGLAESSGLTSQLARYVIDTAVRQAARWRDGGTAVQVAVNVCPRDVLAPAFASDVMEALARHDVPAPMLKLEITERHLLDDFPRTVRTLTALHQHGVELSLDDFGSGHSSLMRLRSLPVDEVKIDRSFVARMATDTQDAAVVRCAVDLARSLGMSVVAEGVEDPRTWERLRAMGVDAVQGWFISAALPPEQAALWLETRCFSK